MGVQWLTPGALWLGALVAVPIAVHLLARQRRRPIRFPSLRFLEATSAPSRRRWHIREPGLLAARMALVLAAAAALAGPIVITSARQARWDAQIARAVVVAPGLASRAEVLAERVGQIDGVSRTFATDDPRQGLADAAAWLQAQTPSRREIVVIGPLSRAVLMPPDVQAVAPDVGLRFLRLGELPPAVRSRERAQLRGDTVWRVTDVVTAAASSTTVAEQTRVPEDGRVFEVAASPEQRVDAEAARRALLRRGVALSASPAGPISVPWTGQVSALATALDAQTTPPGDDARHEPQAMDEATLQGWTRPAAPRGPAAPVDTGDRRLLWAAVLGLLALEAWLRSRPA